MLEASGEMALSSRPAEASADILKLAVAVVGSGSGSVGRTVGRAVMVQASAGERAGSALLETMDVLAASRRFPSRVSVMLTLVRSGESAELVSVMTNL